ncbi:MAG TPA: ABC transporter permease [Gammaproteobacteria bacterium]|nr:ABC transporter permease [Gammaproteobacteria bacterium]
MFGLIWTNFTRKKGRLALTLLSVLIAFLLFGMLMAARQVFSPDLGNRADSRLMTINKVSRGAPLPIAYAQQIARIPGVKAVTYATIMLGWYQKRENAFAVLALPETSMFEVFPEIEISPEQKAAWTHDRIGAVVTPTLLKAYGWKVGQRVPVMSTMKKKDGSTTWDVTIDGVITNSEQPDSKGRQMYIHYDYLNTGRATGTDTVAMIGELPEDPAKATQVGLAIDQAFENASPQTSTSTAKAVVHNAIQQADDIGGIIIDVAIAVFFSMLLVVGAIMFQSTRERRAEFAALRALGFTRASLLRMVIGESLLTCLIGGLIGIGLAAALTDTLQQSLDNVPASMDLTEVAVLIAVGLMIVFGLLAAAAPAGQLWRLSIRESLGRI